MRQGRAKTYRKLMSMYCMSFGFRQPYQVLVDSEMCKHAASQQHDFLKQLGVVLQGSVKLMITQCCIQELYLQAKEQQPAVDLAKTFERRKCNHRVAIPGDECIASLVGETNKHRYAIATQSTELRSKLRDVPAVPIVHINRSVTILQPPNKATLEAKESAEAKLLHPSAPEIAGLPSTTATEPPKKKKKGPKGPNPLSVKKKKPKSEQLSSHNERRTPFASEQSRMSGKRKRDEPNINTDKDHKTKDESIRARKRRRRRGNQSGIVVLEETS
ncbi:uncharacterized protein LAESUDRAFT_652645 [Laetiporus sulphureus 93-53]|uniref:U three protein 23 n=1 Tax=Laetiporus sulphureus 93-53 TaxID=1314785 RepID=A0A165EEM7_9APHY|nr:uncharacterized protein LAESUDRAFT_652645 [Laetiporus sulphureus 93-53]KZT06891.1 hypothetical protein LAESUDRAFT_652645 [Laetiporus sulphureus 93-53]